MAGKTKFESCATSEMVLGYIYTRRYVVKDMVTTEQFNKNRASLIFDATFSVTIGAGLRSFTDIVRRLANVEVTEKAVSSVLIKHNRAMQGAMLMGSSIRYIWHLCRYPNSFYSYMTPKVHGYSLYVDYKQIGSWHSGFNGIKFDLTRNVMAIVKLSERTKADGKGISVDWFNPEQQLADCYCKYEVEPGGLVELCHRSWRCEPSHLVYTAMESGGDPASWTLKQMLLDEIVVENPYGYRLSIPYVRRTISPDTGVAHDSPAQRVPPRRLHTLSCDVVFCPTGINNLDVSKNDDKSTMYDKIFASLQIFVNDLIDNVDNIHVKMEEFVAPVQVRQEIVQYNRHHAIFNNEGSPVFWRNNALQVGLIRLPTKEAQFASDLERIKSTLVCYNNLELRYLNVSSKCWNELGSDESLRGVTFSTWSMGMVLNIIGAYVAIEYTYVLLRSWILSMRQPIPFDLALNLDIQSVGVLSMSRCDQEFKHYPGWFIELVVALSMTWFYFNNWFFWATTRIRNVIVIVTWLVRLGIPVKQGDFNNGISKLCVSCDVSLVLGFGLVLLSKVFKESADDNRTHDGISVLFAQARLNRAWHGTLGQTQKGWSPMGLLFEGWQVVQRQTGALGLVKSIHFSDQKMFSALSKLATAKPHAPHAGLARSRALARVSTTHVNAQTQALRQQQPRFAAMAAMAADNLHQRSHDHTPEMLPSHPRFFSTCAAAAWTQRAASMQHAAIYRDSCFLAQTRAFTTTPPPQTPAEVAATKKKIAAARRRRSKIKAQEEKLFSALEKGGEPVMIRVEHLDEELPKVSEKAVSMIKRTPQLTADGVKSLGRGVAMIYTNPQAVGAWWAKIKEKVKAELKHYWVGSKLLYADVSTSTRILRRLLHGNALSRRERKQLQRTVADLLRLVPFAFFVIVPFMELLLPVALKMFPNMLPSTFKDSYQREEAMKRQLQLRVALAEFLQETVKEVMQDTRDTEGVTEERKATASDVMNFIERAQRGEPLSADETLKIATMFNDELMLDNVSRPQLVAMCRYMGVQHYGNDNFLRFQLRNRIRQLKKDDQDIIWEGLDSLDKEELQQACMERGMRATGLTKAGYVRQMKQWLELSINKNVPVSLLIMSRALNITAMDSPEEALATSMSSMDEEVVTEVALSATSSKVSLEMKELQLESIRYQNEMIADEEKFRGEAKKKEEAAATEALKAKEQAETAEPQTTPVVEVAAAAGAIQDNDISETPVFDAPPAVKTVENIISLEELAALESLASKSIVEKERQAIDQMKQNKSEMDVEGLLAAGRIGAQTRESKTAGLMMKKLETMLSNLEVELDKVDRDVGDRLNVLDRDSDGVLSADELKHAVMTILRKSNTEEDVEWLVSQIDENKDGQITIVELVQWIEKGHQANDQAQQQPQELMERTSPAAPSPRSSWRGALAMSLVIAQGLWALAIPVKNVVAISTPSFVADAITTITNASYPGFDRNATPTFTGPLVLELVQSVLELSLGDDMIRRKFEERGDFVIDDLGSILQPDQHKTFALYYGLVLESSEVLAAKYTPREETIIIQNPTTNQNTTITLSCSAEKQVLQGMLCTDGLTGGPCDDSSFDSGLPKATTKLAPIDIAALVGTNDGWHNNVGLMTFVDFFHQIMRQLFAKQRWAEAWLSYQAYSVVYNPYRLDVPFSSDNYLIMPDEATLWVNDGAYLQYNKTKFESCALSEIVLGYVYVRRYVLDMIQSRLLHYQLYHADVDRLETTAFIKDRAAIIFDANVSVTIGAGFSRFENTQRTLAMFPMTKKATSSVLLKRDRAMQGAMLMGSSVRHMWYMMRYPNSFYSFMTPVVRGDTVELQYRQIGSWHSGFNGMKFDFTRNVMAVIKLSERTKAEGTGIDVDWLAQEQQFADWYRDFEVRPGELVDLVTTHFGPLAVDSQTQTQCYQGLLRKIAQVAWIMALRAKPVMNHLVYTAMESGGGPAGWTLKQMLVNEIVVENSYGYRTSIPYVRATISPNLGNAWPMIPLLNALRIGLGNAAVKAMLLAEMNTTYNALIELEAGYTQFRDVVFCPIGSGKHGVTKYDDKGSMYDKIYPSLQAVINDLIELVEDIHHQMEAEVAPVQVRQELVTYNRHHSIFNFEGSPVFWQNNALQVGLMRLATKEAPFPSNLERLRATYVCYNTLELRYLNVSSKCWNEPNSVEESRTKRESEGLRVLLSCTWSMGMMLNVIGAYVAMDHAHVLFRSWILSGKKPIPMRLALGLGIQCLGVLRTTRVIMMALGVIPLIISYHLPVDGEFRESTAYDYPHWLIELIVVMSMTWFVRLGMELGRCFLHLEFFDRWFFVTAPRLRYLCPFAIALLRTSMPVKQGDFNRGILKLCTCCVLSLVMGFVLIILTRVLKNEDSTPDRLSQLFAQAKLNRAWHGTLAQTLDGWTHIGLLYEGWQVVKGRKGAFGLVETKSSFINMKAATETSTQPLDQQTFSQLCRGAPTVIDQRRTRPRPQNAVQSLFQHSVVPISSIRQPAPLESILPESRKRIESGQLSSHNQP
ncbi:TPA: hypothetical protein N0F65_000091 [Lagenidium giganteum]|uniref:Mitochondrial proton/calcium exchanger protein n=1 Tax=Lagenidium giganteum TaxID=4803 RepID=A0AAV2YQK1_9STRA|nr:TPA: hypothetical protein N0F65_000091 [Lagenidium giganteum]